MMIKICGITTIEAALAVADAGADWLGFVFAPSKRRITPEAAAEIARQLPDSIGKVGVFVNETIENIHAIAAEVGLDYVQLHGDESAAFAEKLALPVIKAFSIEGLQAATVRDYPCEFFLIDSPGEVYRGGSGVTFDWERLLKLGLERNKLILAGGLSAENIGAALAAVQPAGVDVSSGVETNGKKDVQKIREFVRVTRQAE